MSALGPAHEHQADECQHGERLDHIDDVTGDGSMPLHAVERIADRPGSQYGRAVHAAAVGAGPGPGAHVYANREHATRARRIGGKLEPQRTRADDTRVWAEPARPAEPLAVPIEFVAVLDKRRSEDLP